MSYRYSGVIYHNGGWKLESWGNGAAYTLRHDLPHGETESCWLQGDDASVFREAFELAHNPTHLFQEYLHIMERDAS